MFKFFGTFLIVTLGLSSFSQAYTTDEVEKNCSVLKTVQRQYHITEASDKTLPGKVVAMGFTTYQQGYVSSFCAQEKAGVCIGMFQDLWSYRHIPGETEFTSCYSDGGDIHVIDVSCNANSFVVKTTYYKPGFMCIRTSRVTGRLLQTLKLSADGSLKYAFTGTHYKDDSMTLVPIQ